MDRAQIEAQSRELPTLSQIAPVRTAQRTDAPLGFRP